MIDYVFGMLFVVAMAAPLVVAVSIAFGVPSSPELRRDKPVANLRAVKVWRWL